MSWVERLQVALEVKSRLVLRLDPKQAEVIFDTALNYYRDDRFDHPWLEHPLRRLLERSWEILLPDQQTHRILDLLSAPIVGLDGFMESSQIHGPDPGYLLKDDLPAPARTADTEEVWKQIIHLAVSGLRAGSKTRKRAARRITFVVLWNRLTESESVEIARALWDPRHVGDACLPDDTGLADVAFLDLPEPKPGLAERCFRKKWLDVNNLPHDCEEDFSKVLWQVGNAISWLRHRKRSFSLTENEKNYLSEITKKWVDVPVPHHHIPFFDYQIQNFTRDSIGGLCAVLPEITLPDPTVKMLHKKVRALNESEVPGFTLMAAIVRALPDRFDEIVQSMRVGLISDKPILSEDAAWGLFYWMKASNTSETPWPKPPINLVREIGMIIASRRSVSLDVSLQITTWIFDQGSEKQKNAIRELALQGLDYLFEELQYDRRHERDADSIPSLRWRCVQLAVSMAKQDSEETPVVSRWLKGAESDPMPEVRYAKIRDVAVFRVTQNRIASGNSEEAETETE